MFGKRILILGLFLVAGFLFLLNAPMAKAVTWTWDGGGDGHTWTDPKNWDQNDGVGAGSATSYPGATSTVDVVIAGDARVIATTTISTTGGLGSLTLGDATRGALLTIAGNATIYASSTVALRGTSTLAFGDNSANTAAGGALNLGAGNLLLSGYSGVTSTPLTIGANATFTAGTSTVTYTGSGGFYIATTTFYNLTLTPTSTAATRVYTIGNGGNATSTNVLTIGLSAQLNLNGKQLALSGSGTPLVYASDGSFVANDSAVIYSSTSATNIATGTYATLTINGASATKSLVGDTTAVTAVNINQGTLAIGGYTFTATGATWTNSGTVTETTGKVVLAGVGVLSDSAGGSAVGSFGDADTYPTVHVQITDTSLNLLAATAETKTATVTSVSSITDTETVTLTETAVSSGIFQGNITFALSASNVVGRLDYQGGGTVSYTWIDSQDANDSETASAGFVGTLPGGGGGGSSSAATVTTTTTTTAAPTETPAVPATPVAPTLESVQTKVVAVIAKIAALPATPTASDLASIQAEIAAILTELQSVQAVQPTPQGVALGFNFVQPLTLGLRHTDVSNLQNALKTDSSIYPEGLVTGYFGPATLRAVQKFQEKYGIATSDTAGYGRVGPATRAKLNELYGAK